MVKMIVLSMFVSLSLLFTSIAYAGDDNKTYSYQCTGKGKDKKCKTVKKEKISDSITYLDMSVVEGEESELPKVVDKGKL